MDGSWKTWSDENDDVESFKEYTRLVGGALHVAHKTIIFDDGRCDQKRDYTILNR